MNHEQSTDDKEINSFVVEMKTLFFVIFLFFFNIVHFYLLEFLTERGNGVFLNYRTNFKNAKNPLSSSNPSR